MRVGALEPIRMADVPLIYTKRGNEPMDRLAWEHRWQFGPIDSSGFPVLLALARTHLINCTEAAKEREAQAAQPGVEPDLAAALRADAEQHRAHFTALAAEVNRLGFPVWISFNETWVDKQTGEVVKDGGGVYSSAGVTADGVAAPIGG